MPYPHQEADKASRKAELQASYEEKMAAKKAEKEEAGEEGQVIAPRKNDSLFFSVYKIDIQC